MSIDLVRGELERLFTLDELQALSSELLGLDPSDVGGAASKASFARALADRCAERDATLALVDALVATRTEADPRLRELGARGLPAEEMRPGSEFGPFSIVRKLGDGPRGVTYLARREGEERVLKVLRDDAASSRASLQRFLTFVRLAARVRSPGLPESLEAGFVSGRAYVTYAPVDAQPISARVGRSGPLHINEAKHLVRGLLEGLAALHEKGLVHGNVKPENLLVGRGEGGAVRVYLVDAGADRLGTPVAGAPGSAGLVKAASPEQIRGLRPTPQADLYAAGALLFELLTGKPPFPGDEGPAVALEHLGREPSPPSAVAPRGWVPKAVDEIVLRLLAKTPEARPRGTRAVLELLAPLFADADAQKKVPDGDLNAKVDALLAEPTSPEAALALESLADEGADVGRIVEALRIAAEQVEVPAGDAEGEANSAELLAAREAKKGLLMRAARTLERAKRLEEAEPVYQAALDLAPEDDSVFYALEELRRSLGKHEELVEMLLSRSESSESHSERARCFNLIGHLYVRELEDREQGVFALAQALAQETQNDAYATDLERAAGSDMNLWTESLNILSEVSGHPRMPAEARVALFTRLGRWYSEKIARPDLGLPCFQAVLSLDPANDAALDGMAHIYRRAQQWGELGQVLLQRADRAPTPARARDFRAEAAELLETRLNDPGRARDLYEQIFLEDPGHEKTMDGLARIYQRQEDYAGYAKLLERRAEALSGEARAEALCRVAELHEDQLNDLAEARARYEAALAVDPGSLTALRGLDRVYNRTGRYAELLENLERQVRLAATPRQKINLFARIAGIQEEEFLDHAKAASALEEVLKLDPGNENALAGLVRLCRVLGRWEDVIAYYERQLQIVTDETRRVEALLAMGRVLSTEIGSPERARQAFERVLELDPQHAGALESLAHVRAQTGDALAALRAVEALAQKAESPAARADLWVRAAKLLEDKGDRDGAIERFKAALDAQPTHSSALSGLREAYLARGDVQAAADLVQREIELTEGPLAKARLYGELGLLLRTRGQDEARAKEAGRKALDLDPTSIPGHVVLGEIAFEAGHFVEAAHHFEAVAGRVDGLPAEHALAVLGRYVEALSKLGSTQKATAVADRLLVLAPESSVAMLRAARVRLDAGQPKDAAELYDRALSRFSGELDPRERADALLHLGLARLAAGDLDEAAAPLHEAADLEPNAPAPLQALSRVFEAREEWEEVVRVKTRRLDLASGEERAALLLEIGEVLATQIGDRTRAARNLALALEERPDDRRILTKLMQLYSEEKDWSKLVEVVLKLAAMAPSDKQRAKYVHTAAIVTARQMGEVDRALGFYDEVLALDPELDTALREAVELREGKADHQGVERLLKVQIERAETRGDQALLLKTFEELGALYRDKLGWTSEAVDAFEAAQTLDPDNAERTEVLAKLYASDPGQYLDKAVAAQGELLARNAYKPEPYKLLRRLYTEVKRADCAWCVCQCLAVLGVAEPDEERFYRRMRADNVAAAQDRLTNEDWATHLMHPGANPLLTAVFAIIEPSVLRKNGEPVEALGYQMAYRLDLSLHPYPMSQTLNYVSGVLGMEPPLTFQNPNDPGGVSFLHAHTPAIVLGAAALAAEIPTQAAGFIAARHLTYYRPGFYLRHLVATTAALRAWLFAAIKLIMPAFPVAKELEGPVLENLAVLEGSLSPAARDHLAGVVPKLLQEQAIDLKAWIAGVDLTADRAGFVLCNDLELANEMIKATEESTAGVAHRDRLRELLLFAASEDYFALRRRLVINIDA